MNKNRRKSLQSIMVSIESVKYELEDVMFEEEYCRDNIPENLQGSERYTKAEEACEALSNALNYLEDAIASIEEAAA